MKQITLIAILLMLAAILAAGCTSPQMTYPASQGDTLYTQAESEFLNNNLHAAEKLYVEAYNQYKAEGNAAGEKKAFNKASVAGRITYEFIFNESEIVSAIDEAFPDVPAERKAGWLPCDQSQCIESDGTVWYYTDTIHNIRFHNPDLMRQWTAALGETPLYDQLKYLTFAPADEGAGNYVNPVTWEGTEVLIIPIDLLPKTGTLRLWFPLPVETESQRDVTIISVAPAEYIKEQSGMGADLGLAYFEIPLEGVTGDFLNLTTQFRYTQYEQRFTIDPAKVGRYNTSDPEYKKYTRSSRNIALTPEMKAKAQEIVGNETNPYLQAEKIYWHVIEMPYSHISHSRLDAAGIPESVYVLNTGFGDCGTQSIYFAALCRSLGIPARAIGGFQMISGNAGAHFWAEYYIPGYGWIPNDVTVAEMAEYSFDATDDERHQFKAYYASSLDPYRYIIQKDVDLPLVPDPGDVVFYRTVVQYPKVVCDTCNFDPEFVLLEDWKVTVKKV
ncbi:MAG TPA: transglutaminase domain-containing protein [Methanoregula sp.]|nr:transglutaminase domain-containing protein [Methanoregula sp.]